MLKKIAAVLCFLVLAMPAVCSAGQADKPRLRVVTTLFAVYDFARQAGAGHADVSLLLPPGVEAHSFEPRPSDIVRISKADVFIYTGAQMEPWVADILKGVSNKGLVVVDCSKGIELARGEDHGEEGHHHEGQDPHIWLDLGNAQVMVNTIASALAQKDPANAAVYARNAQEYTARLAELDGRFKSALSTCRHRTLVYGGHFVFGYLARRYGLEYAVPYEGFSPNAEPSPRAIAALIDTVKKSGAKCIYYEELLDPKVARTIARETGAGLELLHGAHNVSRDELARGVTFLEIMERNLEKLKAGLECG